MEHVGALVHEVIKDRSGAALTRRPREVQLAIPLEEHHGQIVCYRITLPFLPPSKNVYDSWPGTYQKSAKRKWIRWVVDECKAQQMPLNVPMIGLSAVLVFPSKVKRDPQNYGQTLWHFVPDALVEPTAGHRRRHAEDPAYVLPYGLVHDDSEGRVHIGGNWGLRFAYDLRAHLPKDQRSRTYLSITMRETS